VTELLQPAIAHPECLPQPSAGHKKGGLLPNLLVSQSQPANDRRTLTGNVLLLASSLKPEEVRDGG
jgi:hypothetical protein